MNVQIRSGYHENQFYKELFWGWLGKNITTLFYVILPLFLILGYTANGIDINDVSSVITEAVMLLVTLSVMFFILSFNWDKFLDKLQKKKQYKQLNSD